MSTSIRLFISTSAFELIFDLDFFWHFARVLVMTLGRLGFKVKVIGQSQGQR